jgi:hypothetical protein
VAISEAHKSKLKNPRSAITSIPGSSQGHEFPREFPFAYLKGPYFRCHHGMRTAFAEADYLNLRKRVAGQPARHGKTLKVAGRVRDVEFHPVNGHEAARSEPRARSCR